MVAALVGLLFIAIQGNGWLSISGTQTQGLSDTQAIGMVLYTHYVLAFELAAVILLVAIVAAITLAHRVIPSTAKRQNLRDQLMVNREERVTLVAMRSEPTKEIL